MPDGNRQTLRAPSSARTGTSPTEQLLAVVDLQGNHRHFLGHTRRPNECFRRSIQFPSRSKRIDVISRIFFPVVFALFNFAYWGTYLFAEDEEPK